LIAFSFIRLGEKRKPEVDSHFDVEKKDTSDDFDKVGKGGKKRKGAGDHKKKFQSSNKKSNGRK